MDWINNEWGEFKYLPVSKEKRGHRIDSVSEREDGGWTYLYIGEWREGRPHGRGREIEIENRWALQDYFYLSHYIEGERRIYG